MLKCSWSLSFDWACLGDISLFSIDKGGGPKVCCFGKDVGGGGGEVSEDKK